MAGAVLAVGTIGGAVALSLALSAVGAAAVHAQRAAAAADAAALAAADTASGAAVGVPCERAAEVADASGAALVSCEVEGLIATVRVVVAFGALDATATARAGPPP